MGLHDLLRGKKEEEGPSEEVEQEAANAPVHPLWFMAQQGHDILESLNVAYAQTKGRINPTTGIVSTEFGHHLQEADYWTDRLKFLLGMLKDELPKGVDDETL